MFVCVGSAAVIVITMIRNRHDHVLATPDGLVVVTRRGRAVHPWTDTLEVGWMSPLPVARLPAAAPRRRDPSRCRKLMGRARTERPTRAATLAVYGRRGRRRACDLLARECSRHGVPFTTNGITMLINAPPGSPYRVATPRHRR